MTTEKDEAAPSLEAGDRVYRRSDGEGGTVIYRINGAICYVHWEKSGPEYMSSSDVIKSK